MEPVEPPLWAAALRGLLWPSMAIGVTSAVLWRRLPPGRVRTWLQWIGALGVMAVPMLIVVPWGRASTLIVHQHAILGAWCLLMAVVLPVGLLRSRRRAAGSRPRSAGVKLLLVAAGSLVVGSLLSWQALGDALGPPVAVEGIVEEVEHRSGSPPVFLLQPDRVTIEGRTYRAAGELWRRLEPGMRVEAEALPRTRTLIRASIGEAG